MFEKWLSEKNFLKGVPVNVGSPGLGRCLPCGTDMFRGWGKSKVHLPRVTRSGFKGFTVLRKNQFQSQRLLNETQVSFLGKPLFEMCCFHMGNFSPRLPGGVRACQDGLGHFFSTFARLAEGGVV